MLAAIVGMCGIVGAGSLEPPVGPFAPTMKTSTEVESRVPSVDAVDTA